MTKSTWWQVIYFLLINTWFVLRAVILVIWSISKSRISWCVSFIWIASGVCISHLFEWTIYNILYYNISDQIMWTLAYLLCILFSFRLLLLLILLQVILVVVVVVVFTPLVFFESAFTDDISWELEWQQVYSSLADLNNAVVWIVSICPLISKSSILFTKRSMTVSRAPIKMCIIV